MENKKVSNSNHIYNLSDEEVRAIIHNTSLRLYEASTILDGILNFIKCEMNVPFDKLHNYVYLSRCIKEWHGETGEVLDVPQAKAKFLGDENYDMSQGKIRIELPKFLAEWELSKQEGGQK